MRKWLVVGLVMLWGTAAVQAQAPTQSNPKQYTAHIVGYAHIDMAWLWRWEESTYDVMYNTFRKQLSLMDRYPNLTYAQDQAVVYQQMEHYYPDIFKEIQYRVKTHNWIPVSSTWTQMDENMPDGESLVRQFLYGQKYTKERFGHYVHVAWQPDVFGHPFSMPQIAAKAGIKWYIFERPHDPNRPPIFWWKGLDGSKVLAYNPPNGYGGPVNHDRITIPVMKTGENMGVPDILMLFGEGDHGGGPNASDMDAIATLNKSPNDVNVKTDSVDNYFNLLLAEKKDFPVIAGEMNPVFEGCYTTQVDMKRHNREAEQLLMTAEKMSELAVMNRYRDYYPSRDLKEAWKLALLNQTHDLLPGSGIGPIYQDAAKQYAEVFKRGHRALKFSLECIGLQVDTMGNGVPVVVYNSQSWDRTDLVKAHVSGPSLPDHMVAVSGTETLPVQILKGPTRKGDREAATVAFVAQNVPQMGLKLYRIEAASSSQPVQPSSLRTGMKPRPYIENEFFRVEFDPHTGNIVRLFDKKRNREAFKAPGNFLVALQDTPEQARATSSEYAGPAWNIGLTGKKWDIDKAAKVEIIESGPVRATVRVVHTFRNSEFVQDVSLMPGVPRIDVRMSMDWYERNTFLKAGFPVNVSSTKVAAEIPYGVIERDQTGKEMVMGKWVDVSDHNYGVAILNNGRQGFDAANDIIRLSVIRGPWYPDPRADEGHHSFGYSIYPHAGGWREGKVEFQALDFNQPLLALQEPAHRSPQESSAGEGGGLPESYSFIKTDSDHVILYAMKQMEGFYNKDPILRFFECEGRPGEVSVQFPFRVRAVETNLLEDTIGPIGEGETIHFAMKPWEIKTIRISRVR
ncbi:MAG: glycosyl hydrolase-related protein [Acidobacteria bacterium]|nr:glycosyl hydrolase-related protein [Acidobacteriota bacterium]